MDGLIIAAVLIRLHNPHGATIDINPDQIVSLRAAAPVQTEEGRLLHRSIQCMISLADGKFVGVVEDCGTVKRMIETTMENKQ
jgi:hypothetical protein